MKMHLVAAMTFAVIVATVVALQGISRVPEGGLYVVSAALFGLIILGTRKKKTRKDPWRDQQPWDELELIVTKTTMMEAGMETRSTLSLSVSPIGLHGH